MKRILVVGLVALAPALLSAVGCSGAGPKESSSWSMPWSKKDQTPKPYPNPVRMVATWTPDTLTQTGRVPTRGFGGRIYFYDEKTRTVPVAGELVVHAFAENPDGSVGEVKRYQFTEEQFTQHFSQSDLGASYSVWIPWDAIGGDQMKVSLVPSFKSSNGRLVQGEMALVGLPGKRKSVENIAKRPDAAQRLMAQRDDNRSGLTTTTIPVRKGLETMPTTHPGLVAAAERIATSRQPSFASIAATTAAPPSVQPEPIEYAAYLPLPNSQPVEPWQPQADPAAIAMPAPLALPSPHETAPATATSRPQRLGQTVAPVSAELPVRY